MTDIDATEAAHELREFQLGVRRWTTSTDEEETKTRTKINKRKRHIAQLLWQCGLHKSVTLYPAPAVGGPILSNVDPLDFLFERVHGANVRRLVHDLIDQAIEMFETGNVPAPEPEGKKMSQSRSTVFLVHGRDELAKQTVARYLESLGLRVIILHEQPSAGRTLIEKVEHYGAADFAVVLLTPDDEGGLAGPNVRKPRARQNVILELGYFLGRLGRKHVAALADPEVEKPSDYDGVVYIPWSPSGGVWPSMLLSELREAGLSVKV